MPARFRLGAAYAKAASVVTSSSWNPPSPLTPRPPTSCLLAPPLVTSLDSGALPGKNTTPFWLAGLYGSWKLVLGLKSLNEYFLFVGGVQMLIPGQGFLDIYNNFDNRVGTLVAGFITLVVAF
jgi:hypothetical protein